MAIRKNTNKLFQTLDNPLVIGMFFALYTVFIRFYIFPKYSSLLSNDFLLIQNFIEWFGVAFGLLLALVLVNVWGQFETVERVFENEASAISVLYESAMLIRASNKAYRERLIEHVRSYMLHVIQYYTIEYRNARVRSSGEYILDAIGDGISEMLNRERTKQVIEAELVRLWNEVKELREERISVSRRRIPNGVWMLVVLSSILWLIPFYGLNFSNDWIAIVLTGGVTFIVVTMLIVIKDLDDPFDGNWAITIDRWEYVAKKTGTKSTIIFVYNLEDTIGYKFLQRVGQLFSRELCPLYSLMHTSKHQLQEFLQQLDQDAFVQIMYRSEYEYEYGDELSLPVVILQSGSKTEVLVESEEIRELADLTSLSNTIGSKLSSYRNLL